MNRTASERRHHRDRVIEKRKGIIANAWGRDVLGFKEGQLSKHNLVCSCPMCRDEKYRDHSRYEMKRELQEELEQC